MVSEKSKNKFADKHMSYATPDSSVKFEILKHSSNNELSCASAFLIAKKFNISPDKVGITADLINCRLIKCQLGLFGYKPEKKIITPIETVDQNLINAITQNLVEKKLLCKIAWELACRFKVNKIIISGICENMNIKIKECQLGAF